MVAKKFGKNAEQFQGVPVADTTPSDKQIYIYNNSTKKFDLRVVAEGDVTNLTTDLSSKIAKTTNITALNETSIADGDIAVFNLTNKDIRTSSKTIVTTLGTTDATVPTSKAVKDVTDTFATKSLWDAQSITAAILDNTPAALVLAEQTMVGRITGGNVTALTAAQIATLIGSVLRTDYNTYTILASVNDNTPVALTIPEQTMIGRITSGAISALTPTQIRTLLGLGTIALESSANFLKIDGTNALSTSSPSLQRGIATSALGFFGGVFDDYSAMMFLYGRNHASYPGYVQIRTPNTAKTAYVVALQIVGSLDDPRFEIGGSLIQRNIDTNYIQINGGNAANAGGGSITCYGRNNVTYPGTIFLRVPDAAETSFRTAMEVTGCTDTPIVKFNYPIQMVGGVQISSSNLTTYLDFCGGTAGSTGQGARLILFGNAHPNYPGYMYFQVPNAAKTALVNAMILFGNTNTPYLDMQSHKIASLATPTATTDAANKAYVDARMPTGAIVLWYGSIASIPAGWVLCNGSNGTPNLQDRFVVGAGSAYPVAATGGEATHALTEAELAAHAHGALIGSYSAVATGSGRYAYQAGSTNTLTGETKGSGTAHENRPPYYALAYIMKT